MNELGPSSGLPSIVKAKWPLNDSATPGLVHRRQQRARRRPSALSKCSGVNGPCATWWPTTSRSSSGTSMGSELVVVGADAVYLAALAVVEVAVLVAQDRVRRLRRRPAQLRQRVRPREQVLHRLHRDRPADQALQLRAPQPAADTTVRSRSCPAAVSTPRTRPPRLSTPVTRRQAVEARAQRLGALARDVADRGRLAQAVARHVVGGEHGAAGRAAAQLAARGRASRPRRPARRPRRGCGGGAARARAPARPRPPGCRRPATCAARARRGRRSTSTERCASRHIRREGLVWKTRPGAWNDEPPVCSSGPWSSTTTSRTPPSARSVGEACSPRCRRR